jgi:uncharacterized protein (DUF488 family)
MTIYTIGHSTRPLDAFVALLREAEIECLVDVRTVPRSRTNPHYNRETLPAALAAHGIGYRHMAELGGLRGRTKGGPSPNTLWQNEAFRNYADYALTPSFEAALGALRDLAAERRCAVMCAEAVWWRCHRRIIADYLLARGDDVVHILGEGKSEPARLTPGAEPQPDGKIFYPDAQRSLDGI